MGKIRTSITIRPDIKENAEKAIQTGKFPGINDFSSLVELAIDYILKNKEKGNSRV